MNLRYLTIPLSLIILSFAILSCEKESACPENILGNWRWLNTIKGGFSGEEINPESEGEQRLLIIREKFIHQFANGELISKMKYEIIKGQDSEQMHVELESGEKIALRVSGCTLIWGGNCINCNQINFIRL